ncbi:MAG: hypothetical protein Kow0068_19150 [Marinilabiliales bacterium]
MKIKLFIIFVLFCQLAIGQQVNNREIVLKVAKSFLETKNNSKKMITDTIEVNDKKENHSPIIYPNPTKGKLNIENWIAPDGKIKIYNISGQKIIEFDLKSSIDLSNLNNSVYFLHLMSNQQVYVLKVVINK